MFAGGMQELWNWDCEGVSEVVNDANGELTNFYQVLRNDAAFSQFKKAVETTPFSSESFKQAVESPPELGIGGAWRFYIKVRQSRMGLGGDFATPTTRTRRGMNENVSAWLSAVDGLPEIHERLRRVEIRNLDFSEFISKYDHGRALFYLDPPYVHATRSTTGEYGPHEMPDEQHVALLSQLRSISGKFMLSGYHSDLYDGWARELNWKCHEKVVDNKASCAKIKEKKTEVLWTNY